MGQIRTIQFNEALHRYTDQDNYVYTSVTTVIQNYHEKFDENFWANKKAQETGLTAEQVKQNWKDIRDFACDKGNATHKVLEDSINASNGKAKFDFTGQRTSVSGVITINQTNLHILANSPLAIKYPKIYQYLKGWIEKGWTLYAEKRVYWYEYLIAGTIDCLLVKNKLFMIVDWKTNKDELKFKSGYYKKVNGVKTNQWVDKKTYFFYPLTNIEDCKGNRYTMQLSLYAYLLELWGFKCVNLVLFHIRDNDPPIDYTIPYWRQACENLCTHHKNGLVNSISTNTVNKQSTNKGNQFGIF